MRKLYVFLILGACLLVAALAVACSGDEEKAGTPTAPASSPTAGADLPAAGSRTIGYVTISGDPVQLRWWRVFEAAAKEVGWNAEFADAKGVPDDALRAMQNYINTGADAIIAACVETPWARPALDDAKAKGIPVIAIACPVSPPENAWTAVFAEDEAGLGDTLAKYVVQQLEAAGATNVGVLYDTQFLSGKIRYDAFKAAIADTSIKVVADFAPPLTDPTEGSRKAAADILTAHSDLDAILAIYDWMAPPSVSAIEAAGKQDQVTVYSFYADHVNLPILLKEGSPMKAVVDGPVETASLAIMDELLDYFVNDDPIDASAFTSEKMEFVIFTKDNAPAFGDDYVGPIALDPLLAPWLEKWQQEYSF